MSSLAIAVVLTSALGVFNIAITLSLIHRIKTMRLTSASASSLPSPGTRIQPFGAVTITGRELSAADLSSGSALLAFLSVGCPPCDRVKERLIDAPPTGEIICFIDGALDGDTISSEANEAIAALSRFSEVVAVERGWSTHSPFGIEAFPTLLRVTNGTISAAGIKISEVVDRGSRRESLALK